MGDPFFGGNWLVGGNLDGNGVIDILDYGILLSKYLQPDVRETPCGFRNPNADLNGDGQVDILDMSFLARNFLASDKGSCCPDSIASTAPPRTRVSVQELREKGLDDLANADVDGDGIVDLGDLGSYFRTVGRNGKR